MRALYHYPTSTFSRRARMCLAHKGLEHELRDARAVPEHQAEARRLSPVGTMPVLVDDGRVVGDSTAIAWYLDLAYPDAPRLFPSEPAAARDALHAISLVDAAMNILVDVGTRYHALRDSAKWEEVRAERAARGQRALEALAEMATAGGGLRRHLAGDAWSAGDVFVYAGVRWLAGIPARVATNPLLPQILSVGVTLPPRLVEWAGQHTSRPELAAIEG